MPTSSNKITSGSMNIRICIFFFRHKLYLPSKQLEIVLFKIFYLIFGVKRLFFNLQKY